MDIHELDEYGNLVHHHASCVKQIDPICRCTCDQEELRDQVMEQFNEHALAYELNGGEDNLAAMKHLQGAWEAPYVTLVELTKDTVKGPYIGKNS